MKPWFSGATGSSGASGAHWVMRMRSAGLGRRERQAVRQWLGHSRENARDLLRAETAWRLSGLLEAEDWVRDELATLDRLQPDSGHRRFTARAGTFVALATAASVVLALLAWWMIFAGRYTTQLGEQRRVTLADGSTMTLNTGTRVRVELSGSSREISLLQGEALFQVAKDSRRPFIVRSGQGYARAVGTRFNVISQGAEVTVSVLEGRVEVGAQGTRDQTQTEAQTKLLVAGEAAAYAGGHLVSPGVTEASVERIAAWQQGKLKFESWPLERAVREYNRYSDKPVRLDVGPVADVEISGVFRIGDSSAFVKALGELVNARVTEDGETILLTRD